MFRANNPFIAGPSPGAVPNTPGVPPHRMNPYDAAEVGLALFEETSDALFLFDPESEQILDVNPMAQRLSESTRHELLGQSVFYLFRSEVQGGLNRLRQASRKTSFFHSQEGFHLRTGQDGVWVPVNVTITRLHLRPKVLGLITARDVREQRETYQQLKKMEQELRRVTASIADGLWSAEFDGAGRCVYRYLSPVLARIAGQPAEYFQAGVQRWRDLVHPEDRPRWDWALERMRAGHPSREEYRIVWPDGTVRWVRDSVLVSKAGDDRCIRLDGVITDITEGKQAEEERDRLWELSLDLLCVAGFDGYFKRLNPAWEKMLGWPPEQLANQPYLDFVHPDDRAATIAEAERVATGGLVVLFENRFRCRDGSYKWLLWNAAPLASHQLIYAVGRDITEPKQIEEARRESEAQLQAILDNSPAVIYMKDTEGRYLLVNRRHELLFHLTREQVKGKTDYEIFPPEIAAAFQENDRKVLQAGVPIEWEEVAPHDDGLHTYISVKFPLLDVMGVPHALCGISTDITERKRAEEALKRTAAELEHAAGSERQAHQQLKKAQSQLVQSEKLIALGQTVAGVAHEINNPLAFVNNNLAVLQRDVASLRELLQLHQQTEAALAEHRPDLLKPIRELAERIDLEYTLSNLDGLVLRSRDGLRRIQEIVKNLRDFARLDEGELQQTNLNTGIESTLNIIRHRATKKNVELITELAPLPPVLCYHAKINQVVLNLVANAIDACPDGGRVVVRTEAAPDGVYLHVEDNGQGIDPAVRGKIFDPFFTTKPLGKGTGLGLSISHGIVADHGGHIDVESAPGRGARFTVFLPLRPPRREGGKA